MFGVLFWQTNGGCDMMPVVSSQMVSMVLVLFGVVFMFFILLTKLCCIALEKLSATRITLQDVAIRYILFLRLPFKGAVSGLVGYSGILTPAV